MIEITREELNTPIKEIQKWYKQNLAGTVVKHSKIGDINIYNTSFRETQHHVASKFLPILFHLKELIETGNTSGKIGKDRKNHLNNCLGFIYIYNKVSINEEVLDIRLNILVDNVGKKYYMFNFFKKDENYILDLKMFDKSNFSEGSNIVFNNIIKQNNKKVKYLNKTEQPDPDNPKIGDVFWLGDSIRIEVIDIIKNEENETLDIMEKLDKLLEE